MSTKKFLERRRRATRDLPPLEDVLRGSVVRRTLRCGKSSCHCASGAGHPVVQLSVTLRGGRTEQISVPAALVAEVERQVANYHAWWAAIETVSALNRDLLREARRALRTTRGKRKRR
jgi:hypothetical protein